MAVSSTPEVDRRPAECPETRAQEGEGNQQTCGFRATLGAESRRGLPEWTALISPQKAPLILGPPRCLRQGSPHPRFWRSQAELTFDTQPATLADGCGGDRVSLARGGGYVGGGGGGGASRRWRPPFPRPPPRRRSLGSLPPPRPWACAPFEDGCQEGGPPRREGARRSPAGSGRGEGSGRPAAPPPPRPPPGRDN